MTSLLPDSESPLLPRTQPPPPSPPPTQAGLFLVTMASTLISGAAFGAALVASGVSDPNVITSQLKLQNFHMLQAFLTATATSSIIASVVTSTNYAKLPPRNASSIGLFSRFDANIIGGALLGAGLAIAGACPGTVIAQTAVGIQTGAYAIGGAVAGGIVWAALLSPLVKKRQAALAEAASATENPSKTPLPITLYDQIGASRTATALAFQLFTAAFAYATITYGPASPYTAVVAPVAGGLLIGLAQLVSVLLRRSFVGISGVYEDIGRYVLWAVKGAQFEKLPDGSSTVLFASGVAAGAAAVAHYFPAQVSVIGDANVTPVMAVAGGFIMAVGSRLAGGCTSGHGISGIALLSTSSVVTIASTFVAGIAVALSIY